jgi:hypothetical protein
MTNKKAASSDYSAHGKPHRTIGSADSRFTDVGRLLAAWLWGQFFPVFQIFAPFLRRFFSTPRTPLSW